MLWRNWQSFFLGLLCVHHFVDHSYSECNSTQDDGERVNCTGFIDVNVFELSKGQFKEVVFQDSVSINVAKSRPEIAVDVFKVKHFDFPCDNDSIKLTVAPILLNVQDTPLSWLLCHVKISNKQLEVITIKRCTMGDPVHKMIVLEFLKDRLEFIKVFFVVDAQRTSVDSHLLINMKSLRMVSFRKNLLNWKSVVGAFGRNTNYGHLWHLDLSHNQIEMLEDSFFEVFPKLSHLLLDNNRIKELSKTLMMPVWKQLKEFNVADNELDCVHLCWLLQPDFSIHPFFFSTLKCNYNQKLIDYQELMSSTLNAICSKRMVKSYYELCSSDDCYTNGDPPDVRPDHSLLVS